MPHEEMAYDGAGINHIVWLTRLECGGEDAYPRLFAAMEDPEIYGKDKVRFELMRCFGYFVTESSEHNAEYTPYFLRDDELVKRYDVPVDESIRRSKANLVEYAKTREKLLAGESFPLERSVEYGSLIVHSVVTGEARMVYASIENTNLVENLARGCCVEVAVAVDGKGLRPCHYGELPAQLAAHCALHAGADFLEIVSNFSEFKLTMEDNGPENGTTFGG